MAAIPGSRFRRLLFWSHLSCGITAGLFILMMSVTGALLAYEQQIVEHAARANRSTTATGAPALDADAIARSARSTLPPGARFSLVFDSDPGAPVTVSRGREGSMLLDPYTGEGVEDAAAAGRKFFRAVENWHRWLGGDARSTRAALIDYGNLLFFLLVLSGIYLWLPQVWRWRNWRGLMFFQKRYINAKVRDFNWHHVFSFWMLIPLFLISLSGVVMSFDWANRLVYAAYGEQAPQRRAPQAPQGEGREQRRPEDAPRDDGPRASLESLRLAAATHVAGWQRLTLPVGVRGGEVEVTVELRSDAPRAPRRTVTLNAADASVVRISPAAGSGPQSAGQKARTWMRFVHTGEQYGVVGQTIAALASLAACFLVYTGLALAYRRLLRPLFRGAPA